MSFRGSPRREPGTHKHRQSELEHPLWLWVPGSRFASPGMTAAAMSASAELGNHSAAAAASRSWVRFFSTVRTQKIEAS
jgi:hypothetical protein